MFLIHSIISVASKSARVSLGSLLVMISYHSVFHPAPAMGRYVSMLVVMIAFLLKLGLLVLDGEVRTSGGLPLVADEV